MIWNNSIDDSGLILIEQNVIETIRNHCQNKPGIPESGGVLLGYRRDSHLHVVDATTPQPDDRCMRFRFFRRDPYHQQVAISKWSVSGNTLDYIGEWHTHPELGPSPSSLDLSEWKKICAARNSNMLFLIAGLTGNFWLGVGRGQHIVKAIEVIAEEN